MDNEQVGYKPIFEHGRRGIAAINMGEARRLPHGSILYRGIIFDGDMLFSNEAAVLRYWQKAAPLPGDLLPKEAVS